MHQLPFDHLAWPYGCTSNLQRFRQVEFIEQAHASSWIQLVNACKSLQRFYDVQCLNILNPSSSYCEFLKPWDSDRTGSLLHDLMSNTQQFKLTTKRQKLQKTKPLLTGGSSTCDGNSSSTWQHDKRQRSQTQRPLKKGQQLYK